MRIWSARNSGGCDSLDIQNGSRIKFEMGSVMTGWCKSDSGLRQGCVSYLHYYSTYIYERIRY